MREAAAPQTGLSPLRLSPHRMDSISTDNRDGHRSWRTMTKTLSLYLSPGWLGASWGQQGTSGCRGVPPPGEGWPLSPCPPPGKPLCLWSHPRCCHAGFTFPAPQVSHATALPVSVDLWSCFQLKKELPRWQVMGFIELGWNKKPQQTNKLVSCYKLVIVCMHTNQANHCSSLLCLYPFSYLQLAQTVAECWSSTGRVPPWFPALRNDRGCPPHALSALGPGPRHCSCSSCLLPPQLSAPPFLHAIQVNLFVNLFCWLGVHFLWEQIVQTKCIWLN